MHNYVSKVVEIVSSFLGLGALIGHLKKTIRDHTKKKEENQVQC